jgi:hypothetical protein
MSHWAELDHMVDLVTVQTGKRHIGFPSLYCGMEKFVTSKSSCSFPVRMQGFLHMYTFLLNELGSCLILCDMHGVMST